MLNASIFQKKTNTGHIYIFVIFIKNFFQQTCSIFQYMIHTLKISE